MNYYKMTEERADMKSMKRISTKMTTTMLAAGMVLGAVSPVYAEEIPAAAQETLLEDTVDELAQEEVSEVLPTADPETTPEPSEEPSIEENDPEVTPEPGEEPPVEENNPEVTPIPDEVPIPEEPEVTPEPEQPTEEAPVEEEIPPALEESESIPEETTDTETEESSQEEVVTENDTTWTYHIDYGKYFFTAIDARKGFAQIDKTYAYAKVTDYLNVREGTSVSSRVVGKLPAKALCYVIADSDKDWVYIESGDVRGFVKSEYLQQGKKALKYVTKTGEDNMETAEMLVEPIDNKAFDYTTETVYKVKHGTGEGVIKFADQFLGNPYRWGGNSLTDGIDCSHFVYQILSRCGVYDGEYVSSSGWRTIGEEVKSLEDAQAGDVVCYSGHVAIYDGNGGIIEAKGQQWGITHDRRVDSSEIFTIRRLITETEDTGDNAEIIRNYLMDNGFSKAGTAGIMANIANESYPAFEASSLEIKSINNTGISSDQYTSMVDSGEISRDEVVASSRFGLYSGGRYGYGLCGFTDPTIKAYLYHFTIDQGKSIGSISGQLDSLIAYLSDYNPNLLSRLKNADNPKTAASAFLREYEKCANIAQEEIERTAEAEAIFNAME